MMSSRRPIDEMLVDLAEGFGALRKAGFDANGVRPSSVEFDLPVEAGVEFRGGRWVVLADAPRTRTRTAFDIPTSRLTATIAMVAPR